MPDPEDNRRMTAPAEIAATLAAVRSRRPLVHNITSAVVANLTANALLALGASPAMAESADEVEALAGRADALVINLGVLSPERAAEGTTFEAGCYTDPLAVEHVTGSLAASIAHFGAWDAPVQLRFTTKFDGIEPLLAIPHRGRTRIRFSVNARGAERFEGGTARMAQRLGALRRAALAGFPVGLTVAPIMPLPDWRTEYAGLLTAASAALDGIAGVDLTVELISHRFTPGSRDVLRGWYPGSTLEMDEGQRTRKLTKFGSTKWVYPRDVMAGMRGFFERALADTLPGARLLYWT